jgi:hypothetical protein
MCGGRMSRLEVPGAASATHGARIWSGWDGAQLERGRRWCRSHQLEEDGGAREMRTGLVLERCQHGPNFVCSLYTTYSTFRPVPQLQVDHPFSVPRARWRSPHREARPRPGVYLRHAS